MKNQLTIYMISAFKQKIFQTFDIDMETAKKRALVPGENAIITAATEMVGEKIIKQHTLWNILFPNYKSIKKITNIKNQKQGIDYQITTDDDEIVNIDLKVQIGPDYSPKSDDYKTPHRILSNTKVAAIELYQNNVPSLLGKKTDYFLFITVDASGIYYGLLEYSKAVSIIKEHLKTHTVENGVAKVEWPGYLNHFTSNNGSGIYVKYPLNVMEVK